MSPTRRDVLTMLSAAGAGAVLPAIAFASNPSFPTIVLRGVGNFWRHPRPAHGTANALTFDLRTDPTGTTAVTIMCGVTNTAERLVSTSSDVARFVADLAERIDWFAQDWDAMTEDEQEAHRRRLRAEVWARSKKPCPQCHCLTAWTPSLAHPDCPTCHGNGYVV